MFFFPFCAGKNRPVAVGLVSVLAFLLLLSLAGCDSTEGVSATPSTTARRLEDDPASLAKFFAFQKRLASGINTISVGEIQEIEEVRAKYPAHDRLVNSMVQMYHHRNDWHSISRILMEYPPVRSEPAVTDLFATSLVKQAQYEQAGEIYKRLAELQPTRKSFAISRATCEYHLGRFDSAWSIIQSISNSLSGAELVHALELNGMIEMQRGESDSALRAFEQAVSIRPDLMYSLQSISCLYKKQGNADKAQQYAELAQAARNRNNEKSNHDILVGSLHLALQHAMNEKDFTEARRLIERLKPFNDRLPDSVAQSLERFENQLSRQGN